MPPFRYSLFCRLHLWLFFFIGTTLLGESSYTHSILVTQVINNCFLQPLVNKNSPPSKLREKEKIIEEGPFALGTSKDSLLEIDFFKSSSDGKLRLGRESGLEFRPKNSLILHRGSILCTHKKYQEWKLGSSNYSVNINGFGTWMVECLTAGLKVILLEGKISINNSKKSQVLESGDLVLIDVKSSQPSKPIQIELPLLLGTSRLIKEFSNPLPSKSRMISAAQVQALRLKKRYEAFVGDVSEDKKLQLWALPQTP